MSAHIDKTTRTQKDKPSKWPEKDHKHDKEINMPKEGSWLRKKKGEKTLTEPKGWAQVFVTTKGKTKEGSEIWVHAKILEGVLAAITLGNIMFEY